MDNQALLGALLGLVGLDAATLVLLQARNIIGSSPPPGEPNDLNRARNHTETTGSHNQCTPSPPSKTVTLGSMPSMPTTSRHASKPA